MYKKLSAPLIVQLELTDGCFQLCSHCYRSCQLRNRSDTSLSESQVEYIIERLAQHNVFQVVFTGGEPLMVPAVLKAGVLKAAEFGLFRNLNTNLGLLSPNMVDFLVEHKVAILTTLFSHKEDVHDRISGVRGSHRRLLHNIETLVNRGCVVSVNQVVRCDNALDVLDTGRLMAQMGVAKFSATKAAPTPGIDYNTYRPSSSDLLGALDSLLVLQEETGIKVDTLESYPFCFFQDIERYAPFARRNCTAGVFNCSIGPEGGVRPCSHADLSYGNIFKQSLSEIWDKMHVWRDGSLLPPKCQGCPLLKGCSGGCRFDAKFTCGNLCGDDPLVGDPSTVKMPSKEAYIPKELPELLQISRYLRHRPESFGGVCWVDKNVLFLTSAGYSLATTLFTNVNGSPFSTSMLNLKGFTQEKILKFLHVLYNHNILVEGR